MRSLSKSEKILVSICVIMVLGYGYYKYFLSPVLDKISIAKAAVDKSEGQVETINRIKTANKKQQAQIEALRGKYDEVSKALPKQERNPEITYEVKKLADSSKVIINSISLGRGAEYIVQSQTDNKNTSKDKTKENNSIGKLMVVPVNLSINGNYNDIMNFVTAIEENKRIAEINNFNISSNKIGSFQSNISVNYYYVDSSSEEVKYDFNNGSYGKDNLFQ